MSKNITQKNLANKHEIKKAYFPFNIILWVFKQTVIWSEIKKAQDEPSAKREQPNRFIRWLRLFFINKEVYKNISVNVKVAMIDPLLLQILTIGKPYELSESHYNHEACHIEQVKKEGRLKFIIKYLFYNIKYGYQNNPYEVEARSKESEL